MPGIFGIYQGNSHQGDLENLLEKMITSMKHVSGYRLDRVCDQEDGVRLGRLSLGLLNPVDQPVEDQDGKCRIVFHGELYNNAGPLSDPQYVLNQYMKNGDACAVGLNGIFHFAVYDKRKRQIKLFSDKFGLQPLYYSVIEGGFTFAAEVKALVATGCISRQPDYRSFADFFHFGQILGQRTLFSDVKLVPPAACVCYNMDDGRLSSQEYWHLEDLFVKHGNYAGNVIPAEAVERLIESIQSRSKNLDELGLSLSGGLDSRGILAGLGDKAKGIRTYTLGLSGCADQKLAEKMARIAKTRHEFIGLDQSYISDFENMAHGMIRLSDGMYHPHESTEMLALEYFKKADFKILLRGHGGEIAKAALAYPVMALPEVYGCSNAQEVLAFIFKITNLVARDIEIDRLFTPFFQEIMRDGPRTSLQESCGTAGEMLAPADVCIFYYIREHIRRQVIASLEIFRTQIECRMPYVDEPYLRALLVLPVNERNQGEIHFKLIQRCMPELLKIVNSNTGAPLDAGPLRLYVADKINSLLKRLSIRGFRHYTEFQKWHRTGFRKSSEKIIFGGGIANKNIFNMDHLTTIFNQHASGQKNYGHLLGTIVGLELWSKNFAD
jgi:asparagine synthase (glutamine-hydrolysing)